MVIFNMVGGGGQRALKATVYGYQIAIDDPDPSTRVSYPQTIFGQSNGAYAVQTPASGTGELCMGDWDGCNLISGIRRELGNSTDGWTEVTDKRAAVVGNGTSDAMVYVPTWFMRMENDGTHITVGFSDTNIDGEWKDYAGSVGTTRYGHFRVGCYGAYDLSSKLYSRGSVSPTVSIGISSAITRAQNRGTGYDIMSYYQWVYLTALAVLLYKSTDLQSAMAKGYVGGSAVQVENPLGYYNDYGMAGSSSTTDQMSFFWIQNLWGNMRQYVGGAYVNKSTYYLSLDTGYAKATSGSGFDKPSITQVASGSASVKSIIFKVSGTTDTGFASTTLKGQDGTYFPDQSRATSGGYLTVGGYYGDGDYAGPFYQVYESSSGGTNLGTRLSYRL